MLIHTSAKWYQDGTGMHSTIKQQPSYLKDAKLESTPRGGMSRVQQVGFSNHVYSWNSSAVLVLHTSILLWSRSGLGPQG